MRFIESLREFYHDIALFGSGNYTVLSIIFWGFMLAILIDYVIQRINKNLIK